MISLKTNALPLRRRNEGLRALSLLVAATFFAVSLCGAPAVAVAAAAEIVEENYDNGQLKLKYEHVEGTKTGVYLEYYENGEPKLTARYKNDKLTGKHVTHFENGKKHIESTYKRGQLNGKYTERNESGRTVLTASYKAGKLHGKRVAYVDGKVDSKQEWMRGELAVLNGRRAHARSRAKLVSALKKIFTTRVTMKGATKDQAMALRRLNAYRYLCGLSADVRLDAEKTEYAQAVVDLIAKIGMRSTQTTNPGMPEERFKIATKSRKKSNIVKGALSSADSVDVFMFSSQNRGRGLGTHRMWCLSRKMVTAGFGRTKKDHYALYSGEDGRKKNDKWQVVRYPPAGYIPIDYFSETTGRGERRSACAWSVALNPKYFICDETFEVEIFPLDDQLKQQEPLTIEYKAFADVDEFLGNARPKGEVFGEEDDSKKKDKKRSTLGGYTEWLVFQPAGLKVDAGQRYWVRIGAIQTAQGKPTTVEYLVEFIDPVEGATIGGPNGVPQPDSPKRQSKSEARF